MPKRIARIALGLFFILASGPHFFSEIEERMDQFSLQELGFPMDDVTDPEGCSYGNKVCLCITDALGML